MATLDIADVEATTSELRLVSQENSVEIVRTVATEASCRDQEKPSVSTALPVFRSPRYKLSELTEVGIGLPGEDEELTRICRPIKSSKSDSHSKTQNLFHSDRLEKMTKKTGPKHKAQSAKFFETIGDMVQSVDCDGRIHNVNSSWLEKMGYSLEELSEMSIWDIVLPAVRQNCKEKYADLWSGKKIEIFETIFVTKDGAKIDVEGRLGSQSSASGTDVTIDIFRDITQKKELQRMKDDAIFVASHEIRTPLSSINLCLELLSTLEDGFEESDFRETLNIARSNSDRLIRMLNRILGIKTLEVGEERFCFSRWNVAEVIQAAVKTVEPLATRDGIAIEVFSQNEILECDRDIVIQILTNLLSNAVKFSSRGSRVKIVVKNDDDALTIAVEDEGRGISVGFQSRIFGEFQQDCRTDATEKGGTGLGLAISKKLAEQHGGKLWYKSEAGRGSTFYLSIQKRVRPTHQNVA